jgi:hypothetical protein
MEHSRCGDNQDLPGLSEYDVTTMVTDPRKFFDNSVKRAYQAWQSDRTTEWKMNATVAMLNNMAAWVFIHWCPYGSPTNKLAVYRAENEGQYRTALAQHECEDFALVRDIADGHKHVILGRPNRQVTSADQTMIERFGFDEGFDIGAYQFVVTLDDGVTKRAVSDIADSVFRMWERLLTQWGM